MECDIEILQCVKESWKILAQFHLQLPFESGVKSMIPCELPYVVIEAQRDVVGDQLL